ncbi:hypothetical protein GUJ93_ZPchr0002g24313 [Zizania palustris]|uniref:Uncharacterized protein n=1 Tax=Zizania palustris TaxID=103762 RepID=A0A8J5RTI8_ZIZPA|nr:hypothetical protein GUJ93_ZPchr0002g24313 [Zizania palustris]
MGVHCLQLEVPVMEEHLVHSKLYSSHEQNNPGVPPSSLQSCTEQPWDGITLPAVVLGGSSMSCSGSSKRPEQQGRHTMLLQWAVSRQPVEPLRAMPRQRAGLLHATPRQPAGHLCAAPRQRAAYPCAAGVGKCSAGGRQRRFAPREGRRVCH